MRESQGTGRIRPSVFQVFKIGDSKKIAKQAAKQLLEKMAIDCSPQNIRILMRRIRIGGENIVGTVRYNGVLEITPRLVSLLQLTDAQVLSLSGELDPGQETKIRQMRNRRARKIPGAVVDPIPTTVRSKHAHVLGPNPRDKLHLQVEVSIPRIQNLLKEEAEKAYLEADLRCLGLLGLNETLDSVSGEIGRELKISGVTQQQLVEVLEQFKNMSPNIDRLSTARHISSGQRFVINGRAYEASSLLNHTVKSCSVCDKTNQQGVIAFTREGGEILRISRLVLHLLLEHNVFVGRKKICPQALKETCDGRKIMQGGKVESPIIDITNEEYLEVRTLVAFFGIRCNG